jgi:prepilin-type N-terminal cleavage/methylation domain-containing protein
MRGFTLIETLVAITVLTMIIIGPLTLATRSIGASLFSQNQITASYLAQEAIEYILNLRDTNFLQGAGWLNGLGLCVSTPGNDKNCCVDIPKNNIKSYPNPCDYIKYDANNNFYYNYDIGDNTIFRRVIKITKITDDEAKIEVTVSWMEKFGGQKSFTLQREIFNWK